MELRRLGPFAIISLGIHLILFSLGWLSFSHPNLPLAGGGGGGMQGAVGIELWSEAGNSKGQHGHTLPLAGEGRGEGGAGPDSSGPGAGPEGTNPILAEIRARIERVKRYPELAGKMGITGKVLIRFSINDQGQPVDIAIAQSSGSELLDQTATSTIRQAAPYPHYEKKLLVWMNFEP